jgi:shikimate kinase
VPDVTPAPDAVHLALVGLPGSGKTTTGRRVAKLIKRPFLDFDEEIERREGRSVPEIFAAQGEEHFRALEAMLSQELANGPPMVLAPGGGWITRPGPVSGLRARTRIIWLRVSAEVAVARMGRNVSLRPLLSGRDPATELRRLEVERAAAYGTSDASINTEILTRQELTDEIARLAAHWGIPVG